MKRRTFTVEQRGSVAQLVSDELDTGLPEAQALIARGAVYLDGRRVRAALEASVGAKVVVVLEETGSSVVERGLAPTLSVLFENDELVAVDKPAGVTAQPTPGRVGDSLVDLVSARLGYGAGLVHRLDRETSGVTLFGKTAEATARLAGAFREGRVTKRYLAVTAAGLASEGTIDLPLSRDPSRPGRWRASKQANGIPALTRFEARQVGSVSLVTLYPATGRTHQLRAHLTALGFPLHGDRLYGGAAGPRCLLHAQVLELDGLRVEAPVPADFAPFMPPR